ncbi:MULTISPECIES: hypothetical protein [unclassified Methylobacterium]|jgi:uncharacterized membrane protein AbrB (regulator of aidB expression)|uniref:hypothetical protein n=1 Tax=unclassified Methylobacterium TaxID=2615210 RepID=UPI001352353E|nr:hypothetical protein [Methylobacterium sp. 2A]MWV22417.1 hypothetical protein [Methylobacterium sp. 2A]
MSTFELIAAGIAFILFGIPAAFLIAIGVVVISVSLWRLAFFMAREIRNDLRGRRRVDRTAEWEV